MFAIAQLLITFDHYSRGFVLVAQYSRIIVISSLILLSFFWNNLFDIFLILICSYLGNFSSKVDMLREVPYL